jgi:hypothetical protein
MQQTVTAPVTLGEAAVDGLLGGIGAGLLMAAYLIVAGLAYGDGILITLGRFDPAASASPVIGALAHLGLAGIYGALFGIARKLVGRAMGGVLARGAAGAVYGLGLYAFAAGVLLPAWGSLLQEVPGAHFAVAHLLFGVTLGLLSGRRQAP